MCWHTSSRNTWSISKHLERKLALANIGVLGSVPTPDGFDRDRHCTNVRSCSHFCVIHVRGTTSAGVLLVQIVILHRKYRMLLLRRQIHLISADKRNECDSYRLITSIFWNSYMHPLFAAVLFCRSAVLFHIARLSLCLFETAPFRRVLHCPMLFCRRAISTLCCLNACCFDRAVFPSAVLSWC